MNKGTLLMSILGIGAALTGCDGFATGNQQALSQDKELRAVMDNFIGSEVPEATPHVLLYFVFERKYNKKSRIHRKNVCLFSIN